MGVFAGPDVSESGLVLALDAGNTKSYPGSGTTWIDLSGRGNNGSFVNMDGTNFNSSNGGSLTFDGTNETVNCGNATNLQITVGTICAWINATNTNSSYNGIITKQSAWGLFVKDNVLIAYDWGTNADRSTGITVGNNTWNYVSMTFTETVGTPSNNAIIYLNGSAVLTTTVRHSNNNVDVYIGDATTSRVQCFGGRIAQASIYNRALTAAEIRQNYNATKGRYGL